MQRLFSWGRLDWVRPKEKPCRTFERPLPPVPPSSRSSSCRSSASRLTLAGDPPRDVIVSGRPPSGLDFDATKIRISFSRVARNLSKPVFITHSGDNNGRLFIVEQDGRIKILLNGTVLTTPFLNLTAKVSKGSERGLLGLAFHPDYATNRKFYVNYTNTSGDTVVAEYTRTSNPNVANTTGRILLTIDQPYSNHNGGMLAFGPDRLPLHRDGRRWEQRRSGQPRPATHVPARQDPQDRHRQHGCRKAVRDPGREPVCGRDSRPRRDLVVRRPQPVAVLVRSPDRRSVDRRCRPEPVRGDQPLDGAGRRQSGQLRLAGARRQ